MQTYWPQTQQFIKSTWPKFTDVELKHIDGNFDVFLKYLKEYYNNFPLTEAIARQKLQRFFNKLDDEQFKK